MTNQATPKSNYSAKTIFSLFSRVAPRLLKSKKRKQKAKGENDWLLFSPFLDTSPLLYFSFFFFFFFFFVFPQVLLFRLCFRRLNSIRSLLWYRKILLWIRRQSMLRSRAEILDAIETAKPGKVERG